MSTSDAKEPSAPLGEAGPNNPSAELAGAGEEGMFALKPFGLDGTDLGLHLVGQLVRNGDLLRVRYHLSGDVASVVEPPPTAEGPTRCDGLWEHTCFELFLAVEGEEPYWELNLAPSGHWNLYRLDRYREGLRPELDRKALPFTLTPGVGRLDLTLDLRLPRELALACRHLPLQVGVSAVIEQDSGLLSYWALAHGGPTADFHRRGDFLLRLEP